MKRLRARFSAHMIFFIKCFMEFDCLNGSPVVDIDEGKIAPVELRKATVFKKMRKCVKQLVDGEQRTIGG